MIAGAAAELRLGDPADPATDIGPVIDARRQGRRSRSTSRRCGASRRSSSPAARRRRACSSRRTSSSSHDADALTREVFGPILHVVRWRADALDDVLELDRPDRLRPDLRHPHPRRRPRRARSRARSQVGNVYVNRNTIGADRRLAALRRHGPFRHRAEGGRARTTCSASRRSRWSRPTRRPPAATPAS